MGICPFRSSYENLKKLDFLTKKHNVPSSVKHASYENNYPGVEMSRSLNILMRKELTEIFTGTDEYLTQVLTRSSIHELLAEYDDLVDHFDLDLDLFMVPEHKGYDQIRKKLENDFTDNEMIRALLIGYDEIEAQAPGTSAKEIVSGMMRTFRMKMEEGISFSEILHSLSPEASILSVGDTIDVQTKQGLILFSSLQERPYHSQEIKTWNDSLASPSSYENLIKLTHILLHKFIKYYCSINTNRVEYTFQTIWEVSKNPGVITPNDRFIKVIASNIGPGLTLSNGKSFTQKIEDVKKGLKIYEQYIFGFVEKDEQISIDAIEMKSCPAKNIVHNSLKIVQPYLGERNGEMEKWRKGERDESIKRIEPNEITASFHSS